MAGKTLKLTMLDKKESIAVKSGFDVPVALFNFNRPQLTRQVFEVVRQIKPRRLLLVADGPRESKPDDARLCAEVRAVFEEIDWNCEVSRNFADANMGSFKRNSTGLDWVFDTVEAAIILEDDCVPSLSFFPYCEALLEKYRDDLRVGVISGNNFGFPRVGRKNDSYLFSAYSFTWGWASWRRVWRGVDFTMSWWEPDAGREMLSALFPRKTEWQYWYNLYERIRLGKQKNAWDYQLLLSLFRHSQYSATPRVNLVSNIGFGADATNCLDENSPLHDFPRCELEPLLVHPANIRRSARVDHALFRIVYQPRQSILPRAKNKLARILMRAWKKIKGNS